MSRQRQVRRSPAVAYQVSRRDYFYVHAWKALVRAHAKELVDLNGLTLEQTALRRRIAEEALSSTLVALDVLDSGRGAA